MFSQEHETVVFSEYSQIFWPREKEYRIQTVEIKYL
jgi:hypothetical protein